MENPGHFSVEINTVGGGLKPWGIIFSRMLTNAADPRRISFSMTGNSINRISISAEDARALRSINSFLSRPSTLAPYCSQRDALEILNLPGKHAHLLTEFAGADEDWRMDWGNVLTLAHDRITLTEMSALKNMQGYKLECLLNDAGHHRRDAFGWVREPALRMLARI